MCEVITMTALKNKIGLYTIDLNYLKALRDADTEVFYSKNYESKPFVGIIVTKDNYNYFVPLTSAKPKHLHWANVSDRHVLVYEEANPKHIRSGWIYKDMGNGKVKHLLSVLDIKKMIPVPPGLFKRVNFNDITNPAYKMLLEREYRIIVKLQDKILESINKTYTYQKTSHNVREFHCNFAALEKVYDKHKTVDALLESASDRSAQNPKPSKAKTNKDYTMA